MVTVVAAIKQASVNAENGVTWDMKSKQTCASSKSIYKQVQTLFQDFLFSE